MREARRSRRYVCSLHLTRLLHSYSYVQKTNANVLDTFKAPEQGFIGGFLSTVPFFYYPPSQPTFKRTFDISNISTLPKVAALLASQEFDGSFVTAAVENGYKGIVIGGELPWTRLLNM